MNVTAVRSVLADRCERDASLRAVFDFHRRTFAAEICFHPTRMRGVHFDFCVLELVGELHSKGIHRCLGNVVGRHVVAVDWRTRRRVMRHGTEDAREIHDPSCVAFAQKRQERLSGRDEAKNIRFKCLPPHVERLGAGRFVRIMEHHSGVVD